MIDPTLGGVAVADGVLDSPHKNKPENGMRKLILLALLFMSSAQSQQTIDDAGDAKVEIALESVDTGIDLRNVRMRFLFFETFKFPTASEISHVCTHISPVKSIFPLMKSVAFVPLLRKAESAPNWLS